MKIKFLRFNRIGLITSFICAAASLTIVENGAAQTAPPEKFSVQTKNFALNFEVGDDGHSQTVRNFI